ncbi:exodeoxyribonuclease V beta subunit [Psychrobacter sp. PL19]|uniref:UvrD-helicase domain-containing protein n=1 Tax=Psychrobacter sp. PL19 TaxID=2760711 RepID=UPI002FEFC7BB
MDQPNNDSIDASSTAKVPPVNAINKTEQPPAIRVPLNGKYLIEASAGTGKTWTLTGIVLRLLIEAKRPPEQIIATTFTRAAAAEMRQRINERLVDFYQLLQWFNKLPINPITHDILYPQLKNSSVKSSTGKTVGDVKTNKDVKDDKGTKKSELPNTKITAEQRQERQKWLDTQAQLAGNTDLMNDPVNSYLLVYLLDNTTDYPLADAIRRCALVLTTLDKLFVGTLDSLSQKWLSEYSAETGHQQGMQISDHEQVVIESIIHDAVRAHQSHMYYQQPQIYALLQHTKRLTAPADHLSVAQKALQFISTPIAEVELGATIDFGAYQQALDNFAKCDLKDVEPYFDIEYRTAQGFGKAGKIGKNIASIVTIQQVIRQYGATFFTHLEDKADVLYTELPNAFISKEEGGKVFNKGKEAERLVFINLDSIQALKTLRDYAEHIELYLDALNEKLNRDIAIKVRQKLPSILEARHETTFGLQMVRLNQALSGKQGERLARYIRHHYPVALIDESQDINGEQARMIERIYLKDTKGSNDSNVKNTHRGFLLLVGDPKQAIYGFRGGDVANYNAMKALFDDRHMMSLDVNWRSNQRLITALNHWFGRAESVVNGNDPSNSQSADQLAQLGKDIYYQHITAKNTDNHASWQQAGSDIDQGATTAEPASVSAAVLAETAAILPNILPSILPNSPVSIIHLPYDKQAKYDAYELTALHIAALLASQQTIKGRTLQPSDIGVLGRRKHELKQVEDMLSKLGVPTLETAENNVFDTPIAGDLAALLEAMLKPHRRDIINRVLTSHFYQLTLNDVQALMLSTDDEHIAPVNVEPGNTVPEHSDAKQAQLKQRYQDFQTYLKTAATHWQHNGVLSALHYLFAHNPMAKENFKQGSQPKDKQSTHQNVWVGLADLEDGARYLMDLRHLLDILAQHGMHIGEYELLVWYKKNMNSSRIPEWARQQPLPTESGVQLMTIHKSKGLEFPVVYVIGMDGASPDASSKTGGRNKHKLYLYDHAIEGEVKATQRRLSASAGKLHSQSVKGDKPTDYYAQFETIENYEELRRLAYVAFTRASEQLYMVFKDGYNKTDAERKPSLKWLSCESHKFVLPERLQNQIGWLEYETIATNAEALIKANKQSKGTISTQSEFSAPTVTRVDYQNAYAQIQSRYFKGWAKTSFTALSRQLGEQSQALAIFDDGIEDELDLTDSMALLNNRSSSIYQGDDDINDMISEDDIRFRFVKGANAGTFLHEVFEKIDFTNQSKWSTIIDQSLRQYQLPVSYSSADYQQRLAKNKTPILSSPIGLSENEEVLDNDTELLTTADNQLATDHNEVIEWIAEVLSAPLLASGQPLQVIPIKQRIAELGFNMGLSEDFTPESINDVFTTYLPDEPEKHIQLTAQYSGHIYRYLRGEIDLVYEYAGKYHVVDYKSNYLGNSLSDYNDKNLSAAMNKAGYWLQAAIYQVALHRFLGLRLPDYEGNEAQYLGAVEYVFLRGISTQGTHNYGRIQWQIPFALVQALDEMFGTPNA